MRRYSCLVDIEGYNVDGQLNFACEWVSLDEKQLSQFAYRIMVDEYYQKNAALANDGYRLTDIEVYEIGRGEICYA